MRIPSFLCYHSNGQTDVRRRDPYTLARLSTRVINEYALPAAVIYSAVCMYSLVYMYCTLGFLSHVDRIVIIFDDVQYGSHEARGTAGPVPLTSEGCYSTSGFYGLLHGFLPDFLCSTFLFLFFF